MIEYPFDPTLANLLFCGLVFLAAGIVKGVIGIGLPLVSVPLLAGMVSPGVAISLLVVPVFAANFWQARQSGYHREAFRRFWPAFVTLAVGTLIGVYFLTTLDARTVALIIGTLVVLVSVSQIFPLSLTISPRAESWATPLMGLVAGLLGGISSFSGPPFVMYLVALRLLKDQFVGAIAVYYLFASVPLYASLAYYGFLGWGELLFSAGAAVPVLAGILLGQWLRARVPQEAFRRVVLVALMVVGLNLIRQALAM